MPPRTDHGYAGGRGGPGEIDQDERGRGSVERQRLMGLLANDDAEAWTACRSALAAGARFHLAEEPMSAERLTSTYSRRARLVRKRGQPSLGFARAVSELALCGSQEVAVGHVDDRPQGGWYFQLFLRSDSSAVVACLAVRPSAPPPLRPSGPEG